MSSSPTFQFMAYCPDKTDEEGPARRAEVRESHLANAKLLKANETLKFGHALVDPATLDKPIEEQKMVGSFIVFEAPSLEECKKIIEDDIYYKTGVWDPEKIIVLPFRGKAI